MNLPLPLQALEDLTFRYDEETILNAEMEEKIAELEKRTVIKEVSFFYSYVEIFIDKSENIASNFKF